MATDEVTPEQLAGLAPFFQPSEFRHPEIVENSAAHLLLAWRQAAGVPFTLTSDGRTQAENDAAPGSSPTSLHLLGRAFDIRWPGNEEVMHRVLDGYYMALGWKPPPLADRKSTELELVHSATDRHVHVALFPDARPSRLIVSAE